MDQILEYAPPSRKPFPWKWAAALAFGGWWGSVILGPLCLILVPTALIATVMLAVLRKWRWLVASLFFSPMVLAAVLGAVEFATGTARLECMGLMRFPVDVDPTTRLQYESGGCVVDGSEELTQVPHNFAVMSLLRIFGSMPGSYTGPYPSEADARAALLGAVPLDLVALRADRVVVGGMTVSLRPSLGANLLDGFPDGPAANPADPELRVQYGQPVIATYGGTCLILGIPAAPLAPATENRVLILIDSSTGKSFAQYQRVSNSTYHPRWNTGWN